MDTTYPTARACLTLFLLRATCAPCADMSKVMSQTPVRIPCQEEKGTGIPARRTDTLRALHPSI